MYCTLLILLLLDFTHGASSGAAICDALGICAVTSSGAYTDTDGLKCPWGMHLVGAPTRSDDYIVATADVGIQGPSTYVPGEIMDIHIRVLNKQKKFLGILMYAVQNDGVIGVEGCPSPGCDGKQEVKVGTFEQVDKNFRISCSGQAVTHEEANIKHYHHVFRWRAPEAGSGDVFFRVILKQGSTNGGFFYWPMEAGDLMLMEEETSSEPEGDESDWVSGPIDRTCTQICSDLGRECDRSVPTNGTLDFYDKIKHTQSCQLPLLSSCAQAPPTRDASGLCWLENRAACGNVSEPTNLCDAVEVSAGVERLCPCGAELEEDTGAFEIATDSAAGLGIMIGIAAVVLCVAGAFAYAFCKCNGKAGEDSEIEIGEPAAMEGAAEYEGEGQTRALPQPPRRAPPPHRRAPPSSHKHLPPESNSQKRLPSLPGLPPV